MLCSVLLLCWFGDIQPVKTCSVPFLPREAMLSVVYAVVVSVCLSHSGIVSKRLNVGDHANNAAR